MPAPPRPHPRPRSRRDRERENAPRIDTAAFTVDVKVPEAAGRETATIRALVTTATRELASRLAVAPPSRVVLVMHPTADELPSGDRT